MSWLDTLLSVFRRQDAATPVSLPPVKSDPPPMPAVKPPAPTADVVATPSEPAKQAWVLTTDILAKALSIPNARASVWASALEEAMTRFGIDAPEQRAAFLAQVGHESGRLQYVREIWGPTPAQQKYEGRADLGNTQPGDGKLFLGRGLIQITGRANYQAVSKGLGVDFVLNPPLLERTDHAAMSAAWFWYTHGLNAYVSDFTALTRKINGGVNGLADREALWATCKTALGVTT